jgi:hypothetical protein
MSEKQQAIVDSMPKVHEKAAYKVFVELRRDKKLVKNLLVYVTASSPRRAELVAAYNTKSAGVYQRQGLKIGRAFARLDDTGASWA